MQINSIFDTAAAEISSPMANELTKCRTLTRLAQKQNDIQAVFALLDLDRNLCGSISTQEMKSDCMLDLSVWERLFDTIRDLIWENCFVDCFDGYEDAFLAMQRTLASMTTLDTEYYVPITLDDQLELLRSLHTRMEDASAWAKCCDLLRKTEDTRAIVRQRQADSLHKLAAYSYFRHIFVEVEKTIRGKYPGWEKNLEQTARAACRLIQEAKNNV